MKLTEQAVGSRLEYMSADGAVQVQALAGNILLHFCTKHITLTVPLSIWVYKWKLANLMLGVTL